MTAGGKEKKQVLSGVQSAPAVLNEISMEEERRTETGMGELDRVLGGGIGYRLADAGRRRPRVSANRRFFCRCAGTFLLKSSTFCMYQARNPYARSKCVRCGSAIFRTRWSCSVRRSLNRIEEVIQQKKAQIVIIDSIQTMYNEAVSAAPGSVSQVRESTGVLLRLAKGSVFRFLSSAM